MTRQDRFSDTHRTRLKHLCLARTLFPRLQLGLYMLVLNGYSVLNIRQYDKFLHSQVCGNTYKNVILVLPVLCVLMLPFYFTCLECLFLTCLESVWSVRMLLYVHVWSVSGVFFGFHF